MDRCKKCENQFMEGFKSLNDGVHKFDFEARTSFLNFKEQKKQISQEHLKIAKKYISEGKIFDITMCGKCGEVIDISTETEYVKIMEKEVTVYTEQELAKEGRKKRGRKKSEGKKWKDVEKEMFMSGKLKVGRGRNGKRIKEEVIEREPVEHPIETDNLGLDN